MKMFGDRRLIHDVSPEVRRLLHAFLDRDRDIHAAITKLENLIMPTLADVKQQIADLKTAVQENNNKDDALIEYINGQKATIATLTQQLADAIANGSDPAAIQEVADGLAALRDSINAQSAKADIALGTTA